MGTDVTFTEFSYLKEAGRLPLAKDLKPFGQKNSYNFPSVPGFPAGQNEVNVASPTNEFVFTSPGGQGIWDINMGNFIVAHEMTHFLWLPDTYDSNHKPLPGAEHWLTSDQGGDNTQIPQSQINDILKGVWPDWNRPTQCGCQK